MFSKVNHNFYGVAQWVYWLECWPCKAESVQQWWLEAD